MLDSRHTVGDLVRNKLQATARALMIKQDTVAAEHTVSLAIVYGQLKSCALTDAIGAARMKGCTFALWRLPHFTEHLAGAGEVKLAFWLQFPKRRQHIMRTVDIRGHRGK